jgi:uncharacterized membrane protein
MNNTNLRNKNLTFIIDVALFAALAYIAVSLLHIPYGRGGVLHLGDSVIFIAAALLGKKKAALAAALGMTTFNLLSPYAVYAPYTFVIKGVMGYIAGYIAYRKDYEGRNLLNNAFAFATAGAWMILGYYLTAALMASYLLGGSDVTFGAALVTALVAIPGDIIQVVGGMVIALPIIQALKKTPFLKNRN